ncbi:MAG: aldo/keto reductase [Pelagibacteraceae bacterium]|jgi:aryl-alcohol dehydrogenase-like predicted oxidoreductase|nr:aldo/keto reductase [Pelagibacteraceae bacterium]MBT3901592.1 aldo/keto reductase [Pelagibacteraceae bacterium]MBT4951295.1 aldo/keto reductase [Pelagibacteraceae bacterium]MBT6198436.1 aldo/keto reductase [Pelagibacteraceae bacterium]
MKYDKIDGLDKEISKLIMGNDNQVYFDEAAKLWDYWMEVGGNAFDTAYIYGGGSMEKLLGEWHRKRNNLKELVIVAKGAHTPNCDPESISKQLTESLDRLQTETADIYIMHRDNTEIPVDEFMDVLNEEKNKGRIKIFGGSNWTLDRFKEANTWADAHNKSKLSILNNNLALSKMVKPLWNGCISSNDDKILEYLEETKIAHLSWSSQARGYFLPDEITKKIEDKITLDESSWRQPGEHSSGPLSCFDSEDNRERKKRAIELAKEIGVEGQHIAGAWPINLKFPSFALIGPRIVEELVSNLRNLDIELSEEQVAWLNLKN